LKYKSIQSRVILYFKRPFPQHYCCELKTQGILLKALAMKNNTLEGNSLGVLKCRHGSKGSLKVTHTKSKRGLLTSDNSLVTLSTESARALN